MHSNATKCGKCQNYYYCPSCCLKCHMIILTPKFNTSFIYNLNPFFFTNIILLNKISTFLSFNFFSQFYNKISRFFFFNFVFLTKSQNFLFLRITFFITKFQVFFSNFLYKISTFSFNSPY